jgi:mevalonate pyrophosphate decarboxylase
VATLTGARTGRADIDLTGNWDVSLSIPFTNSIAMTVAQAGTSLSMTLDSLPAATGTIDPTSGVFSVA